MPDAAVASSVRVEVDGQPLADAAAGALIRVVVDDNLHLPDTFELTLQESGDAGEGRVQELELGGHAGRCREDLGGTRLGS